MTGVQTCALPISESQAILVGAGTVRADDPALTVRHVAGPDPLRVGIDVDADCRAIGADGRASETLSVIGPITRGAFWESVAVPDIRGQAERIAARITAA